MLEYSADLDLYMPYIGLHFVKQRAPTSCNSVIKKVVSRTIIITMQTVTMFWPMFFMLNSVSRRLML